MTRIVHTSAPVNIIVSVAYPGLALSRAARGRNDGARVIAATVLGPISIHCPRDRNAFNAMLTAAVDTPSPRANSD